MLVTITHVYPLAGGYTALHIKHCRLCSLLKFTIGLPLAYKCVNYK